MPQIHLPMFPDGVTDININLAYKKEADRITYFNGMMPVFIHDEDDLNTFRMITSQFYINGNVTQVEICRAFGVPPISVKRAAKIYRDFGPSGFYEPKKTRGPAVLTPEVLEYVQCLLNEGKSVKKISKELGIKRNTLDKAILDKRLYKPEKKETNQDLILSNKSERNAIDQKAEMGVGATNVMDRVAAMVGDINEVPINFQGAVDIPNGGVIFSLPALLASGLLNKTQQHFQLPNGFYGLDSIFLIMAFMALARVKNIERLRFCPPGEWGKILGLDRIPEVRTLRSKLKILSEKGSVEKWSADLCSQWMSSDLESAALFYIDGHVRVYNGDQTKLPYHHVARQRLCLRATTDYWVNAMDGQPFFYINKEVDPGLIQVVENEILPRLIKEVPNQPSKEQLDTDPLLPRFTLVFDREGYSPNLMQRLKEQNVACITYHKYPKDNWPVEEFVPQTVRIVTGEEVEMQLAERGTRLGKKLWIREIRKLNESGHQTSVIATHYHMHFTLIASSMFARWSQENFFRYMRQHFGLDALVDYSLEKIPDTTPVVNPAYRTLDSQIRSLNNKLTRRLSQFGVINLESDIAPENVEAFEQAKASLLDEITDFQKELASLKNKRSDTDKHIKISELPEEARFSKLKTQTKQLVDTVKMIAYRAETAMVSILRENMKRLDDARQLVLSIYQTEVDLIPNQKKQTLTVHLHHQANHSNDLAIQNLCKELNETETKFPGTNLQIIYEYGLN
jgi:transposase-like protein